MINKFIGYVLWNEVRRQPKKIMSDSSLRVITLWFFNKIIMPKVVVFELIFTTLLSNEIKITIIGVLQKKTLQN